MSAAYWSSALGCVKNCCWWSVHEEFGSITPPGESERGRLCIKGWVWGIAPENSLLTMLLRRWKNEGTPFWFVKPNQQGCVRENFVWSVVHFFKHSKAGFSISINCMECMTSETRKHWELLRPNWFCCSSLRACNYNTTKRYYSVSHKHW